MQLKLDITSARPGLVRFDQAVVFGTDGGTIGRGRENNLVLPDPQKYVSGKHARIVFQHGTFYIDDSSANGVFLNDLSTPLGKGNRAALKNGDKLQIGDYILKVHLESESLPSRDEASNPQTNERLEAVADQEELFAESSSLSESFGFSEGEVSPEERFIPDDADDELLGQTAEFKPQPDHSSSMDDFFVAPDLAEPIPDDWDRPAVRDIAANHLGEEHGFPEFDETISTSTPNRRLNVQALRVQKKKKTEAENSSVQNQSLVRAFLKSAGFAEIGEILRTETEVMDLAGKLFRELVQGLMQILAARASLKHEFRIPGTLLTSRENNPLKFSMSVEEAIKNLLVNPSPGSMRPLDAVEEAYQDMKDHQVATMAAMQASYCGLLKRFDPAILELELDRESSVPPLRSLKKLFTFWEQYKEFYQRLTGDADDGFTMLFGESFVASYEEQVRRLEKQRKLHQEKEELSKK